MPLKKKLYNLLKWSEKYTKTDMIYLAKGGFWLTLGQGIIALASLLLTLALANLTSKETLGTFRFVLALAGIFAIPTLAGIDTAVLQAISRGKEGSFKKGLKTKLKWGVLSAVASMGAALYYYLQGNNTLCFSFLIIAVFIPLMNSFSLHESFWGGKKKFDTQNKYRSIIHLTSTFFIVLAIFFTRNIFLILLSYFLSWTVLHFIFLLLTFKTGKPNREEDPKSIKYGKHLSLMGIVGVIDEHLDKIILWHFLGADQLAVYFIALSLPNRIKSILNSISALAFPKFAQQDKNNLKKSVPQKMIKIFLFTAPLALFYIIAAPYVFKLLFPEYSSSVIYSQIYILVLLTYSRTLFGTALRAKMKTKQLYLNTIILPPVFIASSLILIPMFGIWGAISALLITEAATFIVELILFKKM